jgi:F-type H+-transporting ATPase subunit b
MLIWQLVLIQIATFVLIILFLRWLLYSHISRALRRLKQLNQENLEKEKVLKEELARAKREAERRIEEAKTEAELIKEQAREEAEKGREDTLAKARKEAKRLINEAIKDCQKKETGLVLQMQDKAVYLATDMVKFIFSESSQKSLHTQLIDELINEIKGLEKEKVKVEKDKIDVISTYPLDSGQKKRLKEVLSSKSKKDITLIEKTDPGVIAGLIIKSGGFVIDGSMKNKLQKILPVMKEKLKDTK